MGNWAHSQSHRHTEGHTMKFENLDPWAIAQWAAYDTLPQALRHDLVMNALLKQMMIHKLTKKIQKLIKTHYTKLRAAGSNESDPVHPNPLSHTVMQVLSFSSGYKSSSPGGMTRAMESSECPPGAERLVTVPSSSSSSRSKSWGGF